MAIQHLYPKITSAKTIRLLIRMVRWRVALTLVTFMLVGVAWSDELGSNSINLLLAIIGVLTSYACATAINDLADIEIDKINLPKDKERPLISGEAARRDMILTAIIASLISVLCGILINVCVTLAFIVALVVNITYSLPPFKISHRALLTPLYLPLGYAILPFCIGFFTSGKRLEPSDLILITALYLLFAGRIILKDFRDRTGDAAAGKQTFLLKYGKSATILTSASAALLGYSLLVAALIPRVGWVSLAIVFFLGTNLTMLAKLRHATPGQREQVAIGVGAKMGNGMLLAVLTILLLESQGKPAAMLVFACLLFIVLYGYNFTMHILRPERALIAYKA